MDHHEENDGAIGFAYFYTTVILLFIILMLIFG